MPNSAIDILSQDYFSLPVDNITPSGHFYLKHEIIKAGIMPFTELLDYIVAEGYIKSDDIKLFSYRFTGRAKPVDLKVIEWNGRRGKAYELIYLIRTLTERGDYNAMHNFFYCSQWPASSPSAYANCATRSLREFISSIYPIL